MRNPQPRSVGKQFVDVVGAATVIVLFWPLFLALAMLVKATSRGPILFTQVRLGRGGVRFRLLKFRTMRADAEDILRSNAGLHARYVANGFKLPDLDDPRVTTFGRFLRRSGLDELPQLINVLSGAMSLVGPRPIVEAELRQYPEYVSLLREVRPGITGLWQVSGVSSVDYARRAGIESHYVAHHSLRLDLSILLQTLGKVALSCTRRAAPPPQVHPWCSQPVAASGLACDTGSSTDD